MTQSAERGVQNVGRLLKPRSIAIAGANAGTLGGAVLANLEGSRFAGALDLISRTQREINGRACVASIDDLPEGVDVVLLNIPADGVLDAVEACGRRGVGGVVVFAAGYAEAGEAGAARQRELADLALRHGIALNGPNCMGFVNVADGVALTFEREGERPSSVGPTVGVIAQSGAMAVNMRSGLEARGLGISYAISTGNEAVCGVEDFLAFLIDDPGTRAVAIFAEQIRRPRLFVELAARARRAGKPIVLMHPGRSRPARAAAQSHTGALAGDHDVMRTVLGRQAVVVVDALDTLFDATVLLAHSPRPTARKVVVLTNSGALRGVCLDAAETCGLELAELSSDTTARLAALYPPGWPIENPFDMGTFAFGKPELFGQSAETLLADPNGDALLVTMIGGAPRLQVAKSDHLLPVFGATAKPVAFNIVGDDAVLAEEFTRAVRGAGVPFFRSLERAVAGMARVTDYARLRAQAERFKDDAGCSVSPPWSGRAPASRQGRTTIPEHAAKEWLRSIGVRVPGGRLAATIDEARSVAAEIGYRVVLKAQAAALAHKSDAGGVIVGIRDAGALEAAWGKLHASIARERPGLVLDGVLVESMAQPGLELMVAARRDPHYGPVLVVGLGGVMVEALGDVRLLAADLSLDLIEREIRRLRAAALLERWRGRAERDVQAVAEVLALLGQALLRHDEIDEIEINPLVVYEVGLGVVALDALMMLNDDTQGVQQGSDA